MISILLIIYLLFAYIIASSFLYFKNKRKNTSLFSVALDISKLFKESWKQAYLKNQGSDSWDGNNFYEKLLFWLILLPIHLLVFISIVYIISYIKNTFF